VPGSLTEKNFFAIFEFVAFSFFFFSLFLVSLFEANAFHFFIDFREIAGIVRQLPSTTRPVFV